MQKRTLGKSGIEELPSACRNLPTPKIVIDSLAEKD